MGDTTYYSLTGDQVNAEYFKHANMVPFNESLKNAKINNFNSDESILDNMNGSGTQFITKSEQAPLFAPLENAQYARSRLIKVISCGHA